MKKFIIKLAAILCLIGLILSTLPVILQADAATPDEEKIQTCRDTLIKGFEPELQDFLKFLDTNFQNKSSTSSLTELAIARYREYRDSIKNQFAKFEKAGIMAANDAAYAEHESWLYERVGTLDETMQNYAVCEELVNTYISKGRAIMLSHINTAASQKKTIMLIEKFKIMNTKLKVLNMRIAEMYGLLSTFANKFSGYICKKCMKKLG